MSKKENKMSPENVQGLLAFRKRGHKIRAKKGKGFEYNREDFRKETRKEEEPEEEEG
jgi:hypothetical protein